MLIKIFARNKETTALFKTQIDLPTDAKLHPIELKNPQGDKLKIEARSGLYYPDKTLDIFIEEDGSKKVLFELLREENPHFFFLWITPRDINNKRKFTKTKWEMSAQITRQEEKKIICELVGKNPGLSAHQLGKLFGAPIGETLKDLLRLGRIKKVRTTTSGRYQYYPL